MALGDRRRLGGRRWATAWRLLRSGDLPGLVRRTLAFLGRLGDRPTLVDYTQWRHRWVEVDDAARVRIDDLVAMALEDPSCGGNPVTLTTENLRKLFEATI